MIRYVFYLIRVVKLFFCKYDFRILDILVNKGIWIFYREICILGRSRGFKGIIILRDIGCGDWVWYKVFSGEYLGSCRFKVDDLRRFYK